MTLSPFELARASRNGELESRNEALVLSDPALAEFLGMSGGILAGVQVSDLTVMGLSGFFRGVSILAGTVAGLPLNTYQRDRAGDREKIESLLDKPHVDLTQFEWVELMMVHLIMWGNAYHAPVWTAAGELRYLNPVAPWSVTPVRAGVNGVPDNDWGKAFKVKTLNGRTEVVTPAELYHVPGLGFDGLKGLSLLSIARQSLGTAIAADQAAGRQFGSGLLLGGVLTSNEELTDEQADDVKRGFKARTQGVKNAGDIAFIPANLSFTPWTMSNEDAQFLESRNFGIEEQARWLGLPKHLLAIDGASTWGAGLKEMNHGLARYTFRLFTSRIEQRLTRLVGAAGTNRKYAEFSYDDLLQPIPEEGIPLLIKQVEAGLITPNEYRRMKNLPPLKDGDEPRKATPAPSSPSADPASQPPAPPDPEQENPE